MSVEEAILEKVRSLAPEQQQRILDFAEALGQESLAKFTQIDWQSPAIGMWRDREEMQDSAIWVRQVRQQEWNQ